MINAGMIISTLQIVQANLFIVVVTTISEWVNRCNLASRRIKLDLRYTPSIVRVSRNRLSILVNDSNYITLQVLNEVLGNRVVKNTANAVLVIIERDKSITAQSLTKNLGAVEGIGVKNTVNRFNCSNAVLSCCFEQV